MNTIEIRNFIRKKRKLLGLTQSELADKLKMSFQAISKWETGVTIPDSSILLELSEVLDVSVDRILLAGKTTGRKKGVKVSNIIDGFEYLEKLKMCFGEHSTFYLGAIKGINENMNMNIEERLNNDYHREVLYTEVILQYIIEGYYVDMVEVKEYIKSDKMINIISKYVTKYQN